MSTSPLKEHTPPRGAIYIPSRAYNGYQQWRDYDSAEAARDLGYAASVHLDALRVWLSYEYWLEQPEALGERLDDLLSHAAGRGIRIMPSLFESCGVESTRAALEDTDPRSAVCVVSPAWSVHRDEAQWAGPRRFVEWFMHRYADDQRLLAIELINEPYLPDRRMEFARAMFQRATGMRGRVPLTVGCSNLEENLYFLELGIDILQFHGNFPADRAAFRRLLGHAHLAQDILGRPIWLTEWQRLRARASGWDTPWLPPGERASDYASLADIVRESGLGSFFWSLMVKPAYLIHQRRVGTINGLFHEDGAVWSLADARAIANDPGFQAEQRPQWPDWARPAEGGVG